MTGLAGSADAEETKKTDPVAVPPGLSAVSIISRASEFLAKAQQISVKAETSQELLADNGMKVQFTKEVEIYLRRPDRLRVTIATDEPRRSIWYDGKNITLMDHRTNFYGKAAAPDKIESMITQVEKSLGVVFPLDDFAMAKPFLSSATTAKSSLYLGLTQVSGKRCHQVAFQHEAVDWQAWVEDGPKPFIRKLVITYKLDEGAPQFTAYLKEWDLGTKLPDFMFTFEAPPGASEIQMLSAGKDAKADLK